MNALKMTDCDFAVGCFEQEISMISSQGWHAYMGVARRKNWKKYVSSRDFLFSELAGKHWAKAALCYYQGKGPRLEKILDPIKIQAWAATLAVAAKILNSNLEFKTWSVFRRTVLLKTVKG